MTSRQISLRILPFLKTATSAVCSVTKKLWTSNGIAFLALAVSFWNAWQNWVVVNHQKQETILSMARQVTVTLRRFDPDVDPLPWEGLMDRESVKDRLFTAQVFNDGDAEIKDVVLELLTVKHGKWTLNSVEEVDRLGAHTESRKVVGGSLYDPLTQGKGRVTFTDKHGSRWVRWSDGRLLAHTTTKPKN